MPTADTLYGDFATLPDRIVDELPRNAIGKVLKRDLRDRREAATKLAE